MALYCKYYVTILRRNSKNSEKGENIFKFLDFEMMDGRYSIIKELSLDSLLIIRNTDHLLWYLKSIYFM